MLARTPGAIAEATIGLHLAIVYKRTTHHRKRSSIFHFATSVLTRFARFADFGPAHARFALSTPEGVRISHQGASHPLRPRGFGAGGWRRTRRASRRDASKPFPRRGKAGCIGVPVFEENWYHNAYPVGKRHGKRPRASLGCLSRLCNKFRRITLSFNIFQYFKRRAFNGIFIARFRVANWPKYARSFMRIEKSCGNTWKKVEFG